MMRLRILVGRSYLSRQMVCRDKASCIQKRLDHMLENVIAVFGLDDEHN